MNVIVSDITEEGLEVDGEASFDIEGSGAVSKGRYKLRLESRGSEVVISGGIEAVFNLSCGRCLRKIVKEIPLEVELFYRPVEDITGEYALSKDDLNTGFYSNDAIDIDEITREQMLLSVPMKPLCSNTCKGICPKCGKDINEGDCGCELKVADPRLLALERLLKKGKE